MDMILERKGVMQAALQVWNEKMIPAVGRSLAGRYRHYLFKPIEGILHLLFPCDSHTHTHTHTYTHTGDAEKIIYYTCKTSYKAKCEQSTYLHSAWYLVLILKYYIPFGGVSRIGTRGCTYAHARGEQAHARVTC